MSRIIVNKIGETVEPFAADMRDSGVFSLGLVHTGCKGIVDMFPSVSQTHNVFVCRKCHLRFAVPKKIKTWGDLKHCGLQPAGGISKAAAASAKPAVDALKRMPDLQKRKLKMIH